MILSLAAKIDRGRPPKGIGAEHEAADWPGAQQGGLAGALSPFAVTFQKRHFTTTI
jgi:hypothetical protein